MLSALTTESGAELLIHVGIDTVKLDGKGFTKKVSDGDKIHAGDVLIEADLDQIMSSGISGYDNGYPDQRRSVQHG